MGHKVVVVVVLPCCTPAAADEDVAANEASSPHLVPANMATAAPLAYSSALSLPDPEGLAIVAPRDSAGAASNNTPMRGRLAEGYRLHVLPSEAVSLQD